MKATELQLCDYVNYRGQIIKVTSLYDKGGSNEVGWGIKEDTWVNAINVEPIPLTPEILEKNGFKKFNFRGIDGQHEWTWWNNTLTNVSLWCRELNDNTKDGWMIRIESPTSSLCVKVEFLHELQHALRLCGIEKEIDP